MKAAPDLSDAAAALQTAILIVAPDGRVWDVNAAAEAVLNMSAASLKGRLLTELLVLPMGFDPASDVWDDYAPNQ